MALKHLALAAELLRGGMAVSDIAAIVKLQDTHTSGEDLEKDTANTAEGTQEEESQKEEPQEQAQEEETEEQPQEEEKPKPKQKPLNRAEMNAAKGKTLVEQLNELF